MSASVRCLSIGQCFCDDRHKHTECAAHGIAESWIVDPEEKQVTVCSWVDGQYEDKMVKGDDRLPSVIVPILELTVEPIFRSGLVTLAILLAILLAIDGWAKCSLHEYQSFLRLDLKFSGRSKDQMKWNFQDFERSPPHSQLHLQF